MEGTADMNIPPLFRCPISLDLFKDPVTLSTGQTYDRSCIEKWVSQGNFTCPVTMQKLDDMSMVPNHTLRHLIDNWLSLGGQYEAESFEFSDAGGFSGAAAKRVLESGASSSLEDKVRVLDKVHSLSLEVPLKNYGLVGMGFFGSILECVFRLSLELDMRVVERALSSALKLMPFSDLTSLKMLQEKDKYEGFLSLFQQGSLMIKKSLCLIVEAIASSLDTRDLTKRLVNSGNLLQIIVCIVKEISGGAEAGIRAVSALSTIKANCDSLVRAGTVEALVEYISNVEKLQDKGGTLVPMATSVVENLLAVESGKGAILRHPRGIKTMVSLIFRVSDHGGSDSAVNVLTILCTDSRVTRERAVVEGMLIQLLLLLQSQCSGRTKGKARTLLKLIRAKWNEDMMNHHHAL